MSLSIEQVEVYIPANEVPIEEVIEQSEVDFSVWGFNSRKDFSKYYSDFLGIRTLRVEQELNALQMTRSCLDKFFQNANTNPAEIDIILVSTDRLDNVSKNLGHQIIQEYGLRNAIPMNLSGNNCANIEYAISFLDDIFSGTHAAKSALLIGYSKVGQVDDRFLGRYGIVGDGAGVVLLSNKKGMLKLLRKSLLCYGNLKDNAFSTEFEREWFYSVNCLKKILDDEKTIKLIKKIVSQNANILLLSQCLYELQVSPMLIQDENLTKYGHLDCVDILINIRSLISSNSVLRGDLVLCFGVGWAGSFASLLFEVE